MFSKDKTARNAIQELEEKFLKLQREFHSLEMEWSNAYDKLTSMMQRIAKRAEVLQKEIDGGARPLSPDEEAIRADLEAAETPAQFTLSPSQARLQAAIQRNRRKVS